MSTERKVGICGWVLVLISFLLLRTIQFYSQRFTELDKRMKSVETNAVLSFEMLSRAERVVGRLETNVWTMTKNTNLVWKAITNQAHIGTLTNIPVPESVFTNVILVQDAQGSWRVQWPTNKP